MPAGQEEDSQWPSGQQSATYIGAQGETAEFELLTQKVNSGPLDIESQICCQFFSTPPFFTENNIKTPPPLSPCPDFSQVGPLTSVFPISELIQNLQR